MKKYIKTQHGIGLKIDLCKGCAEMLKEYNPYVTPDGQPIPRKLIEINIVPSEKCDNYLITQ